MISPTLVMVAGIGFVIGVILALIEPFVEHRPIPYYFTVLALYLTTLYLTAHYTISLVVLLISVAVAAGCTHTVHHVRSDEASIEKVNLRS